VLCRGLGLYWGYALPTVTDSSKANSELLAPDSSVANCESLQSDADGRLIRWKLHRTAQTLLPRERVAFCMRRIHAATVDVYYSPTH
jgi:hypothetical protein